MGPKLKTGDWVVIVEQHILGLRANSIRAVSDALLAAIGEAAKGDKHVPFAVFVGQVFQIKSSHICVRAYRHEQRCDWTQIAFVAPDQNAADTVCDKIRAIYERARQAATDAHKRFLREYCESQKPGLSAEIEAAISTAEAA